MQVLEENDIKDLIPNTIMDSYIKLKETDKNIFLIMYSVYEVLLINYLIKKINIKSYDLMIQNSKLSFIPIFEEKMDIYQLLSADYLKYLYVRNNIHIEKLDEYELDFLKKFILNGNLIINDESLEFIEKTYKKVILEDNKKNGEKNIIFYGPQTLKFSAPNNALVIGFRYNEFNYNNMDDETWDFNHDKQLDFLREQFKKLEQYAIEKLQLPVKIIKYDDFSVNYKK